jgi:hypothetical protein
MKLPDLVVKGLRKIAARPLLDYTFAFGEDRDIYEAGVLDGGSSMAQYVLEQLQEEVPNA